MQATMKERRNAQFKEPRVSVCVCVSMWGVMQADERGVVLG